MMTKNYNEIFQQFNDRLKTIVSSRGREMRISVEEAQKLSIAINELLLDYNNSLQGTIDIQNRYVKMLSELKIEISGGDFK